MATVQQFASASLRKIQVAGSEAPLQADEYQDYLDALNNYMASLEAQGINLSYTAVNNIADEVTIPSGAKMGVIANMAILVSSDYGGVVSEALVLEAKIGMQAMRKLGQSVPKSHFPSNLPVGGANQDGGWVPPFYWPHPSDCSCSTCRIAVIDGDQTFYLDCENPIQ